jgi:molybdopterin synthase sulfur carrier subunit
MVTLRFFAAARAAVGSPTLSVAPGTIGEVIATFGSPVLDRCSVLVNGIAAIDPSQLLVDGDVVDLLPPFAGG